MLTGCSTFQRGDGDRTAGRVVDDKRITASVKDRLDDETVYKFNDIDVRTYQGVVQLSGFVKTEEQKARAGRIAEETPGVARVVNSIVLKPEGQENLTPTGRAQGEPMPADTTTSTNTLRRTDSYNNNNQ